MSTTTMKPARDESPFAGYSPPDDPKPLGGYAILMAAFTSLSALFALWFRRSGRELPERMDARDLALLTVASHKTARVITKDKVTATLRAPFTEYEGSAGPGEVSDSPRGRGVQRVIGELLTCPYCLGMWTSAALTASLLVAPRFTRWACAVLASFTGADVLQIAYKKAADTL
jgi:hypothetical protein